MLPVASTTAGVVELRVRPDPARGDDAALPRPDLVNLLLDPGHRGRPVRVHARRSRFLVAAVNVFFRDVGNSLRHALRLWFYLSPGCTAWPRSTDVAVVQDNPILLVIARAQPVRDPVRGVPGRDLRTPDGGPPLPDWRRWRRCSSARSSCCARRRSCSSASSRVREGPVMAAATPRRTLRARRPRARVIDGRDLGVRYSLRFTPKTTLRAVVRATSCRGDRRDVLGAARRDFKLVHGESLGGHRAERRRQEHAPPGAGRDHHAVRGRGRRARPGLEAAHARRRVRPGADRSREHPARRRVPGHRRKIGAPDRRRSSSSPTSGSSSMRRSRPTRRGCGRGSGSRSRPRSIRTSCCSTRCSPPATRCSAPSRRPACIELVRAAKAIVLVTHDMNWVTEFCNRAMLLERGHVVSRASRPRSCASTRSTRPGARPRRPAARIHGGRGGATGALRLGDPSSDDRQTPSCQAARALHAPNRRWGSRSNPCSRSNPLAAP